MGNSQKKSMLDFWLFAKSPVQLSGKKKAAYAFFNVFLVLLASFCLCVCSLSIAYGPAYSDGVFTGYFENPLILLLNYAPVLGLFILLYAIIGKSWIAFLSESVVVMGLTVANFFLLKFRDDPLMFTDILYFREALRISAEGYNYGLTEKMIICFSVCILLTVVLALFQRYTPKPGARYYAVIFMLTLSLVFKDVYFSKAIYDNHTDNYKEVVQWAPTQKYVAKGFVYPFVHSIRAALVTKPDGYDEQEAAKILEAFSEKDIDDEKKVNIIAIMLEAYCDIGTLGIEGIDESVYELYRRLKDENMSGRLITNIFAAGTIDSERAFLTGYPDISDYRLNVNSYVHYLASQGYTVDGSHPSENWFYNRQNSNKYLGFNNYRFAENYFLEKYGDMMRADSVVFDDFYDNYLTHIIKNKGPYFGFHVTYQGHAPYETSEKLWGTDENPLYMGKGVSEETDCILNNYLGTIKDTGWRLWQFVEKIKKMDEPCVLLVFGDHKPWLGDGNSVYKELGVNIDVSTLEGFLNYYSTEYVIAANDAAKEILDNDFTGKMPATSPCFLMNIMFDELGFEKPSYMKFTDTIMDKMPALNSVGVIDSKGRFYQVEELPEDLLEEYDEFKKVSYYESTNFKY